MSTSYWSRLGEIDFSHTIERLVEGFIGREWLFESLDNWLNQEDGEKFYLLTGEPGVGKSAIAARLTQHWTDSKPETGKLAAYHFCRAGDVETVRPGRVVRSLATQLVNTLPGYKEALKEVIDPVYLNIRSEINIGTLSNSQVTGIYVENLKNLDPREEFRLLIQAPLAALSNIYASLGETPPSVKVFLIDSLDEAATTTGQENMVTLLASLYQARETLPPWIRFLLTARPDQSVLTRFLPLKSEKIEELEAKNLSDIERYIQGRVDDQLRAVQSTPEPQINNALVSNLKPLQQRLEEADLTAEKLVGEVKELSHGNFLYTKLLLNSIASGEQSIKNLSALPKNLNDIYHRILRYRCSFRGWLKRYQPILGALSVAQESIDLKQLSNFIAIETEELKQDLDVFQQFLDQSEDERGEVVYSIFHQSLREYLLDEKQNHDFWCDAKEQHDSVINYFENESKQWQDLGAIDLYGRRNLARHLVKGDRVEELHELLRLEKDGKNAWFKVKDDEGDTASFLSDVKLAWEKADEMLKENPKTVIGQQCYYALIVASLNTRASKIPIKLLVGLIDRGNWKLEEGLAYARQIPGKEYKANALIALSSRLLQTDPLKSQLLQEIREIALTIIDKITRSKVLLALALQLQEILPEALSAVIEIESDIDRAEGLVALSPNLSKDLSPIFFRAALDISSEVSRASALEAMAPKLINNLLKDALQAALSIKSESSRIKVLAALCPRLPEAFEVAVNEKEEEALVEAIVGLAPSIPEGLLQKTFKIVLTIREEASRTEALIALAPKLSGDLLQEAFKFASTVQEEGSRAKLLAALSPYLSESLLIQVFRMAQAMLGSSSRRKLFPVLALRLSEAVPEAFQIGLRSAPDFDRAHVLTTLTPCLPVRLLNEAFQATLNIKSKPDRAKVLAALAVHLPEVTPEALEAIFAVDSDFIQSSLLSRLVPSISEPWLSYALEIILKNTDESYRTTKINILAPYLPKNLLNKALKAVLEIRDEPYRVAVLDTLSPQPVEFLAKAFEAAIRIEHSPEQANSLDALAARLPECLLEDALKAVLSIKNEATRFRSLAILVPYLPGKLLQEEILLEEILLGEWESKFPHEYIKLLIALNSYHFPENLSKSFKNRKLASVFKKCFESVNSLHSLVKSTVFLAFERVLKIENIDSRLEALIALALKVPRFLVPSLLKVADYKIPITLIPYLPKTLLIEVIKNVEKTSEPDNDDGDDFEQEMEVYDDYISGRMGENASERYEDAMRW